MGSIGLLVAVPVRTPPRAPARATAALGFRPCRRSRRARSFARPRVPSRKGSLMAEKIGLPKPPVAGDSALKPDAFDGQTVFVTGGGTGLGKGMSTGYVDWTREGYVDRYVGRCADEGMATTVAAKAAAQAHPTHKSTFQSSLNPINE